MPVLYGAVDIDTLKERLYASADPLDICFRVCIQGIQSWVVESVMERVGIDHDTNLNDLDKNVVTGKLFASGFLQELVMLIVDDCDNKRLKDSLHKTFRSLRPARVGPK